MKKFFKNFTVIFFLIILLFILSQIISINNYYVNKSLVTFDVNNVRSKPVKILVRKIDIFYSDLLKQFSSKHKEYYTQIFNEYKNLPDEILVKSKKENFSENIFPLSNVQTWFRSHGNNSANRFSNLKIINKNNLNKLKKAWTFEISDAQKSDLQANPIIINEKIYFPSNGTKIYCINGKNGELIWEFDTKKNQPARRGLVYFQDEQNIPKIFFSAYNKLFALNADNGKIIKDFGKNGFVNLRFASITAPAIYKNKIIITTSEPALEVYSHLGNLEWKYYLKDTQNNKKRIGGKRYDYSGGNPWGGFSLDEKRGIAYVSTGNAGKYFHGVQRPGDNKFSNSVIAIDINKKEKIWDFQEVRHDIWNYDIPSTPILGVIKRNNKKIDVVIVLTKLGNTIILDRLTGETIYDYVLKKAPVSEIPGEKTSFYQPQFETPKPFSEQYFSNEQITNIKIENNNYIKNYLKKHKYGFFEPNRLEKKNIQFGFHGGAEWSGGSFNVKNGHLYVSSSNIIWETSLKSIDNPSYYDYYSKFNRILDNEGYPGNKPPWGTLTSINLNNGSTNWQVPLGQYEELIKKGIKKTGTENYSGVTGTESGLIISSGTLDKKLTIFDANDGKELWSHDLPYIGSCPPSTYVIDGEQYILICATGGNSLKDGYPNLVEFGNKIIAFKPEKNE